MYADLVELCRKHLLRPDCPLASEEDMDIPVCVNDGPSILSLIRKHHAAWAAGSANVHRG